MSGPNTYGFPNLLVWGGDNIEENTMMQAAKAARLPFVPGHVALMPDAHVGIGATVGSVIPTQGAIIPAAVGVDIGCGMIAARLHLNQYALPDNLDGLHSLLAEAIPSGVGKGTGKHRITPHLGAYDNQPEAVQRSNKLWKKTGEQFGTLGSGNHFVEVCLDDTGDVWIVLHSGSRGVGNELAQIHMKKAKGLMRDWFIELEDPDLAYLVEGTDQFREYIHDMLWAQEYALANREQMMTHAIECVQEFLMRTVSVGETINCHHNFTERENHHGKNLWITRKGAIRVREGDRGVIPGSMATGSFIVTGLGNPSSYCSASHGAGRKMSRTKAKQQLTVDSLNDAMSGKAWNAAQADKLVDEHPDAYKDLGAVMEAQSDLVQIDHRLTAILNLKGT